MVHIHGTRNTTIKGQRRLTWSRELFCWAATIFSTRGFTSQVLSDTPPADRARPLGQYEREHNSLQKLFEHGFGVLLPLLDLLNHKPGARVEWQPSYSFVGIRVLENFEQGEEVYNNYGPRDNEGLLLAYGFAIEGNPFDHVNISIKGPPGSPLDEVRTWPADPKSDPERKCYIFDIDHIRATSATSLELSIFSYDLLDSVSLLTANDRELQTMFARKRSLLSLGLAHGFEDHRNILSAVSQLIHECKARLTNLRNHDPRNKIPSQKPRNSKQYYARIYRDSQAKIFETAIAVALFILVRASTTNPDVQLVRRTVETISRDLLGQALPDQVLADLEAAASKLEALTRPKELFSISDMTSLLPHAKSESLHQCFAEIESNWLQSVTSPGSTALVLDHVTSAKARFAILLAALQTEASRGTRLPSRLQSWLNDITGWYPPSDPNWTYVPHSGPWAPGEEPPQALVALLAARALVSPQLAADCAIKQWLRPEMLCWGWNVMEEERVMVPAVIESIADMNWIPPKTEDLGVLMYYKQY